MPVTPRFEFAIRAAANNPGKSSSLNVLLATLE